MTTTPSTPGTPPGNPANVPADEKQLATDEAYATAFDKKVQTDTTILEADLAGAPLTPLAVSSIPDQVWTVGTPITPITIAVSGGIKSYFYAMTPVPSGISFANGTISGTPTSPLTKTPVAVTITDSESPKAQSIIVNFNLTIAAKVVPPPVMTPVPAQKLTVGVAVNIPVAATGGQAPLTFEATGLPASLTFNETTKTLTGTPTTADIGDYQVVFAVLDSSTPAQVDVLPAVDVTVSAATVTPPPPPPPPPVPSGDILSRLSVYGGPGTQGVADVKAFTANVGGAPAFAMDFLNGDSWATAMDPKGTGYFAAWQGTPYKMVWGIPCMPGISISKDITDKTGSAYTFQQGAAGAFNAHFVALAQEYVAAGRGSDIFRLMWEFNGGWFPWAANGFEAEFIAYWQQIVEAIRSVPGANFEFAWNPTLGDQGVGDLAGYYPGDAFVDHIGADVYDQAWASYPGAPAEWNTILNQKYGLAWLVQFANQHGKKICIPEGGLNNNPAPAGEHGQAYTRANTEAGGGDDATFVTDYLTWAMNTPNVSWINWYNVGNSLVTPTIDPLSLAAIKAMVAATAGK